MIDSVPVRELTAPLITAGAVDCWQADVTRCRGIMHWLTVASLAAAHHLHISGPCAPSAHAHVAGAGLNLRHLEYFHDHLHIEEMFFAGALSPRGGALRPDHTTPGHELSCKDPDAEPYRVA